MMEYVIAIICGLALAAIVLVVLAVFVGLIVIDFAQPVVSREYQLLCEWELDGFPDEHPYLEYTKGKY